jgi:uncharacterized protein YbbC (DUF1343 family)
MRHAADLLHDSESVELVALFGPEHGIRGDAQDMEGVEDTCDESTGTPEFSLYGASAASLRPTGAMLEGIDVLVVDLQDVGSRYYTFAATMLYAMESCAERGIEVLVLDRPNPIGGVEIEGPTVDPGYESFVGAHPIPIRHGMTIGELAGLYRAERRLDLALEVVGCQGWTRAMHWPETGLRWVIPSPNMPNYETALVYPGGCLIEGTNLSEGRGTTRPFEQWGAPWIEPASFPEVPPPGVLLRACAFRPVFHKRAGQVCRGLYPHVIDHDAYRTVLTYVVFLEWARNRHGGDFEWRREPYEFVEHPIAIDLLFGSSRPREAIEVGDIRRLHDEWDFSERSFAERREPFLLYD